MHGTPYIDFSVKMLISRTRIENKVRQDIEMVEADELSRGNGRRGDGTFLSPCLLPDPRKWSEGNRDGTYMAGIEPSNQRAILGQVVTLASMHFSRASRGIPLVSD